jgi:hypothetical protein
VSRSRNIKPGFFRNADLVELPVETRLLFIGLWGLADREGRLDARPKQIKMEIYPADSFDVDAMLQQLRVAGFIERYEVNGNKYIQVANFTKHQNPHRDEKASTIPAPCKHDASTVQIGLIPESLLLNHESLIPETNTPPAAKHESRSERFREFWEIWPATDRRTQKAKCRDKWKTHNLDAIADEILEHIAALKKTEKWKSGFEPAPMTYLNGRQWEDGLPTIERPQANAPPYESEKDRGRREVFEVLCGGKRNEPVANERDITGFAERVD